MPDCISHSESLIEQFYNPQSYKQITIIEKKILTAIDLMLQEMLKQQKKKKEKAVVAKISCSFHELRNLNVTPSFLILSTPKP